MMRNGSERLSVQADCMEHFSAGEDTRTAIIVIILIPHMAGRTLCRNAFAYQSFSYGLQRACLRDPLYQIISSNNSPKIQYKAVGADSEMPVVLSIGGLFVRRAGVKASSR
jgi:hypothetical protein